MTKEQREKIKRVLADFSVGDILLAMPGRWPCLRRVSWRKVAIIGKVAASFVCVGLLFAMTGGVASSQSEPPKYGDVPAPNYGGAPAPKYGDVPAPKYGDVPAPKYGNTPAPKYGDTSAPKYGDTPKIHPGHSPLTRKELTPPPPAGEASPKKADFTGRYFGYEGRTLHTWDFNPDGTFLHTRIVSGSGTNVRNSERGTFRLADDYVELKAAKTATGFTTPSVGGRETLVGGGTAAKVEVVRLKIQFLKDGIVLDGVKMRVKTW